MHDRGKTTAFRAFGTALCTRTCIADHQICTLAPAVSCPHWFVRPRQLLTLHIIRFAASCNPPASTVKVYSVTDNLIAAEKLRGLANIVL